MKKLLFISFIFLSGCALTYKIQRHYSQGNQVLVQKYDGCCSKDVWGEVAEQPNKRDSLGKIIYRVKLPSGWTMPFSEDVLDSLNAY